MASFSRSPGRGRLGTSRRKGSLWPWAWGGVSLAQQSRSTGHGTAPLPGFGEADYRDNGRLGTWPRDEHVAGAAPRNRAGRLANLVVRPLLAPRVCYEPELLLRSRYETEIRDRERRKS